MRLTRFWAFPTVLIVVWLAVAAFSLSQLATVIPSLSAAASIPRLRPSRGRSRTAPTSAHRAVASMRVEVQQVLIASSLLVPDLGVRGAGVDVRAAQDKDVRLARGVGEVGRGLVVEVVAARRFGDGVGAGDGGEAGQRAVGVDGGELLLGGAARGAVVEAAARQDAAAGDRGAELLATLAQAGCVGGLVQVAPVKVPSLMLIAS